MTKGKTNQNPAAKNELRGGLENRPELKSSFPFSVPDGYFEELSNRINKKVNPDINPSTISVFINRLSKPLVAVPVMVLIVIAVAAYLLINKNNDAFRYEQELTLNEILEELPYFYENVEEDEIIKLLLVENSESSFGRSPNPDNIESLSDDELIEYLLEEDVNNDLIINF